jgi:hypothetical protein
MERHTHDHSGNTGSLVRKYGFAIALAVGALFASSNTANAQQANTSPADPGVRCAAKIAPGQYEFYLPGERATDVNGNKWVCGPDGQWFRDYSALTTVSATFGIKGTTTYTINLAMATAVMR